jgi:hypothetical protein
LKFDCFVAQIPSLIHLLEVDEFVALNVELEDLLVESLRPSTAQDINKPTLGDGGGVGKGEEELRGKDSPLIDLGVEDLDCR